VGVSVTACPASRLLADAAVNPLADEVGVAVVAGVLLDHVDQDLSQRDRVALLVARPRRSLARGVGAAARCFRPRVAGAVAAGGITGR
jgi:hypothetical protein